MVPQCCPAANGPRLPDGGRFQQGGQSVSPFSFFGAAVPGEAGGAKWREAMRFPHITEQLIEMYDREYVHNPTVVARNDNMLGRRLRSAQRKPGV